MNVTNLDLLGWIGAFGGLLMLAHPVFMMQKILERRAPVGAMGSVTMNAVCFITSAVWIFNSYFIQSEQLLIQNIGGFIANLLAFIVRLIVLTRGDVNSQTVDRVSSGTQSDETLL